MYSGGVTEYPGEKGYSGEGRHPRNVEERHPGSEEKHARSKNTTHARSDKDTSGETIGEEVNVNRALPPLTKHQGSSHVYGGSGSLVVREEDNSKDDCKDDWVDAASLSSFSQNVPVESNRPVKDHVVCCTGNLAVQVGRWVAA